MSKREINRVNGKVAESIVKQRRNLLDRAMGEIDRERKEQDRAKKEKNLGPRNMIIKAYKKNGNISDAYKLMDEFNKKFGKEVYTQEMINSWINEEFGISNNKNEKEIDDDAR